MKKFISVLACLYLATHISACTSGGSSEEEGAASEEAAISEEMGDEGLAEEKPAAEGSELAEESGDAEGFLDDQLPAEDLGEKQPTETAEAAPSEAAPETTETAQTAPAEEEIPPAQDIAAAEPPASTFDSGPVAVDPGTESTPPPPETTEYAPPVEPVAEVVEAKPVLPLLKVQTIPYRAGGQLLNAVYLARPGDTFSSISTMIYGSADRVKDLKKANSWVSKVKPGHKIYYNSPKRPNDETALLNYYEDQGVAPQVYMAKQGDNIRKVSSELLGYDQAWKEVWSTNAVESKGELAEGTELKYWTASAATTAAPQPPVAVNELPPPPPVMAEAPPPPAMNELPPPPPPEPIQEVAPPPPPPMPAAPMARKKIEAPAVEESMLTDDMIMALAGAGILVAGLAAIVVMRKRKAQREMAAAFGDTQVGT